MKIFLFGSREITWIPKGLYVFLGTFVKDGDSFIVGDCYGADLAWQKALKSLGADFTVYHIGSRPRNSLSNKNVPVKGTKYTDKDDVMIEKCDKAICIHTNSPGSLRNIRRLRELGKSVWVYGPEEIDKLNRKEK